MCVFLPSLTYNEGFEQEEQRIIRQRGGIASAELPATFTICVKHRGEFGRNYPLRYDKCANPMHEGGKLISGKKHLITYDRGVQILENLDITIPCGSYICHVCSNKLVIDLEREKKRKNEQAMEIDTISSSNMSFSHGVLTSSSSGATTASNYDPTQEDPDKQIKALQKAANDLLTAAGKPVEIISLLKKPYEETSERYKNELRNDLLNLVVSSCEALTKEPKNQLALYQDLVKSRKVEEKLSDKLVMPKDLKDLMISYNNMPDGREKTRLLSFATMKYKFVELNKFNFPRGGSNPSAEDKLVWTPTLKRFAYDKADLHNLFHGYAFAPIVKKVIKRSRVKRPVIEAIFDFVASITQKTAFGTISIKDEKGKKVEIAKVIRNQQNEETVRQLKSYLLENGFDHKDIPSRSTMLKILKCMPAAITKSLHGINATVEDSRLAYITLEKIITELQKVCLDNDMFTEDMFDSLLKHLKISERYLKTHFIYQLSETSKISSHCLNCACSGTGKEYESKKQCESLQNDQCQYCQLLPTLTSILRGILSQLIGTGHISDTEIGFKMEDIDEAEENIFRYMCHSIRNMLQNSYWENLMAEHKSHRAFLTQDWAMKKLAEKFHEKTTDWFGKVHF